MQHVAVLTKGRMIESGWYLQMLKDMCRPINRICPLVSQISRGKVDSLHRWMFPLVDSWDSRSFEEALGETR